MKTVLLALCLFGVAIIVLFVFLGVISRSGKAPGLIEGRLSSCPEKPNCVCSEHKDDTLHYVEPVIIPDNSTSASVEMLKDTVRQMGGSIQAESDTYLAATFSSAIFGFVDDMEIRIDSLQDVIHVRSASRVGHSDMGVNRQRAELFKQLMLQKVSEANP
ncbi:MAG: DUF1499 domain-containing protein [Gammaproteobacteria bacterium]|jgi:uncharacterized protein (DUF1499 family)